VLGVACTLLLAATGAAPPALPKVTVLTGWTADCVSGHRAVCLREYVVAGARLRLLVDPATLGTRLCPGTSPLQPLPWSELRAQIAETAYGRAQAAALKSAAPLQDAGLRHVAPERGIDLTLDLCPSRRPLDRELFAELLRELADVERPVPLAIAVTGVWLDEHQADLAWLVALVQRGDLSITWVNHSFHHRFDPHAPLARNFLLERGARPEREILDAEAALVSRGLTPSVFFRFPGLVSDTALVDGVVGLGLLPLGSDAWLAKGERPQPGSIVLVHANGNEPLGVRRFLELLRSERAAIRQRRWLLLDLRESVAESGTRPPG